MSDYRPGKRRRRSRGRRGGRSDRSQQTHQDAKSQTPSKPKGFLVWLKKLFGVSDKSEIAKQPQRKNHHSEHPRNRNGTHAHRKEHRETRGATRTESPTATTTTATNPAARRKAELLEVTTTRLYVGNLSYDISESDLFELFSQAGKVRNVEIARDRESEKSKGFGFVEFATVEDAKAAQAKLNEYELAGRPLLVSGAKAPTPRRSASAPAPQPAAATLQPETSSSPAEQSSTDNV